MLSKDGATWTPSAGLRHGLPTIGVVEPPSLNAASGDDKIYDAIVIGAGYAGLTATRDLATQGKKTLLLEGRDRLGGRTWHATINGFNYELGGTWIHWHMPHIYREVSLYGLQDDWTVTQIPGSKEDYTTLSSYGAQRKLSKDEEVSIVSRVWRLFCNVDGDDLRQAWKYPFGTKQSQKLAEWDTWSCKDRLDQIRRQLSVEELGALESFLQQMGGSSLKKMGFLNALHWWVLGSHTPTGLNDIALHTRLTSGNSTLHRLMFDHAVSTGNLSYRFQSPVASVKDAGGIVAVTTRDGVTYKAKNIICTVPLNVLSSIEFSPELPQDKQSAMAEGSVNKCNKVHVDLNDPDWISWAALGAPGKGLVSAFGDGLTPADNSHLVAFGPDPDSSNGIPLGDPGKILDAMRDLLPKEKVDEVIFNRIVYHDWNADEFSKGTWCYLPPGTTTKSLAALQRPHGNVLFASADFSDGWRGWIDGAVQIGTKVAKEVVDVQAKQQGGSKVNGSKVNGTIEVDHN
ncbi:Amine oxidase [Pleurostoma richardsiae]|uniref:Amine oxidase n=1 Tax=Pleurostoma richardsiae TaxID=41990 RepID=A0AA38VSY1_9PEZI|nr:Amine oxidase [Pleurostoma richardsiae]